MPVMQVEEETGGLKAKQIESPTFGQNGDIAVFERECFTTFSSFFSK